MGQSILLRSTEVFGNRHSSLQPPSPCSALGTLRKPLGFESIALLEHRCLSAKHLCAQGRFMLPTDTSGLRKKIPLHGSQCQRCSGKALLQYKGPKRKQCIWRCPTDSHQKCREEQAQSGKRQDFSAK